MRDINRIEPLLNDLKELWARCPDIRLCQLLHCLAISSGWEGDDLFYVEDDVIINQLKFELLYPGNKDI